MTGLPPDLYDKFEPLVIPVKEARQRIISKLQPVAAESLPLAAAFNRVLAADTAAKLTHPPSDISAMDGFAVRGMDVVRAPVELRLIGEAPAGKAFDQPVRAGEAVRIFTGSTIPEGTDTVVVQENTELRSATVRILEPAMLGKNVRSRGLDFAKGDTPLLAGRRLGARDVGLGAAMGLEKIMVRRKPRVAILCTGSELVVPGTTPSPNQIVSSNGLALAAVVSGAGGEPIDLGIVSDDPDSLRLAVLGAKDADMLVTVGGASVGDHDLIRSVLGEAELQIEFWKVALRPGKPMVSGLLDGVPMLGLPGNPVSALVCSLLFLRPAIEALLGIPEPSDGRITARLGCDLRSNDCREDYMRSTMDRSETGELVATPFPTQDSSQLSLMARASCLTIRPPHAPAAQAGDSVQIIPFELGLDRF